MVASVTYALLFAHVILPGIVLGDLAFRCPSCTAELLAACPKVPPSCREIVRELGCGCCPVCARQEGELCGVYTPRCSSGLRCYPSAEAELPLQQLIQGLGRCGQKVDLDVTAGLDEQTTNEVHGTENPLNKRQAPDAWCRQGSAIQRDLLDRKMKQKVDPNARRVAQDVTTILTACQQELNEALKEISKMSSVDNRGPLENLYTLKFPNCDRHGLYNRKQCNMSTHGQRGECWCVNPVDGHQIPATPRVRGDPNCYQFLEPTISLSTEEGMSR